jgi:hypothetical protein
VSPLIVRTCTGHPELLREWLGWALVIRVSVVARRGRCDEAAALSEGEWLQVAGAGEASVEGGRDLWSNGVVTLPRGGLVGLLAMRWCVLERLEADPGERARVQDSIARLCTDRSHLESELRELGHELAQQWPELRRLVFDRTEEAARLDPLAARSSG